MFYSKDKRQFNVITRRAFFLLLTKIGIFFFISLRLFNIQITNSGKYKTLSKNNQINIEILYPLRGIIKDRNSKLIATNVKVFDLYVITEKTYDINKTLNSLSQFIEITFEQKREIILLISN